MVFQSYALFPHLTVAGNVGYALRVRGDPRADIAARVEDLLRVVQLEGLGGRRPDELSGGQQQRVALARALSVRPRLLLLDEPLSNLDANLRVLMREEIKRLQRELRLTVAYVTHDQEEAMSISDRIAVMRAGRIEQVGTPAEIYERPATEFVARFVGTANFVDGELAGSATGPGSPSGRHSASSWCERRPRGSRWGRASGSSCGPRPCASCPVIRPMARRDCRGRSSAPRTRAPSCATSSKWWDATGRRPPQPAARPALRGRGPRHGPTACGPGHPPRRARGRVTQLTGSLSRFHRSDAYCGAAPASRLSRAPSHEQPRNCRS